MPDGPVEKNGAEDDQGNGHSAAVGSLLVEYEQRFAYEFNSIDRRWKMLTVFIAVSGFSLASFHDVDFKATLAAFNMLIGVLSIAYWLQVRSRAYKNGLRLKQVAAMLGIVGLVHLSRQERVIRLGGVSFYAVLFMGIVSGGWALLLLNAIGVLHIP